MSKQFKVDLQVHKCSGGILYCLFSPCTYSKIYDLIISVIKAKLDIFIKCKSWELSPWHAKDSMLYREWKWIDVSTISLSHSKLMPLWPLPRYTPSSTPPPSRLRIFSVQNINIFVNVGAGAGGVPRAGEPGPGHGGGEHGGAHLQG